MWPQYSNSSDIYLKSKNREDKLLRRKSHSACSALGNASKPLKLFELFIIAALDVNHYIPLHSRLFGRFRLSPLLKSKIHPAVSTLFHALKSRWGKM